MKDLPVGAFGAAMGLAGLGLAARAAAPLFPGVFRAPAYFTELWVALGVAAFLALGFLYLLKAFRATEAFKAELRDPASLGFRAALPLSMVLLAGGLAPYLSGLADSLWWTGVVLLLAMQAWAIYGLAAAGWRMEQVNPGWLMLFFGGIVVPGPGIALGHADVARAVFVVAVFTGLAALGLLARRALKGPPLPERLRPSWFIVLVPPALLYANGVALGGPALLEGLFFLSAAALAALLFYARRLAQWPFGAAWWAITFPLDAFAFAAARYALEHPAPAWKALAGFAIVLATLAVVAVLARSLFALLPARGRQTI